ncbi:bifunctional DNA-binding transcriptional regulator/O6-methylguanine-DNA methyltransferase Ada [Sphingosinicella microcystinivorans]|uniref:methylated-DNA--[protein]-cysteine S-methyltransferase n=2 Tax=Sphingosinicella microcystinivorans TaxID=335406 RepID=A0AAD1D386_SPHMI|nr:bifunctional DNA-binding transcriptional regulator/O6-methylguanine-DNA methyltransferase Ada [Sphingosinicella microcystinivorans]BBE32946.1 bifunctional transcriptional activator/DNA repair enzyme protein Ada [Sphingosinicella microcystinivorans]
MIMETELTDQSQFWDAVVRRDRTFDGRFVYAVKRSGVYCRPSCPARTPRRENVRFYGSSMAAEADGYRACLRCRPRALEGRDPAADSMTSLARYIETHADTPLPLARLAEIAGLSSFQVQRAFTAVIGVSPKAFQTALRMKRLKASLKEGDGVAGAIFEAGFGSTSRAYERMDGHLGMTPAAYRAGGVGETIAWACRATGLGLLLMAATGRGVCAVDFGDEESTLVDRLRAEFPRADIVPSDAAASAQLDAWIDALGTHLAEGAPHPDIPVDLRGTAFQMKVWRFLLSVPSGSVVSYAEVAAGIGAPSAVRAAASACGANRIAVLIPCHRVLRGDGGIGGYRWGVERKCALLAAERRRGQAA